MNSLQQAFVNGFVKRAAEYGINQHQSIKLLKQATIADYPVSDTPRRRAASTGPISPHPLPPSGEQGASPQSPPHTLGDRIYEVIGKAEEGVGDFLGGTFKQLGKVYDSTTQGSVPYWNEVNELHPYGTFQRVDKGPIRKIVHKVTDPIATTAGKVWNAPVGGPVNERQAQKGEDLVQGVVNVITNTPPASLLNTIAKKKMSAKTNLLDGMYHSLMLAHKSGLQDDSGQPAADPRVLNNHTIGAGMNFGVSGLKALQPHIPKLLPRKLKFLAKPMEAGLGVAQLGSGVANLGLNASNVYMGTQMGKEYNPFKPNPTTATQRPPWAAYGFPEIEGVPPYMY